jgi:hypothetical protein
MAGGEIPVDVIYRQVKAIAQEAGGEMAAELPKPM